MKKYIVVLFLITIKSFSQTLEFNNFKYTNGNLTWQKVYTTNATTNNIVKSLKTTGIIKNITEFNNSFTGTIENLELDYRGFGKTGINTPFYIVNNYLECFILVELKENKYRVTLKEIKLKQITSVGSQNNPFSSESGELTELSFYTLKGIKNNKPSFKKSFIKTLGSTP